LPHFSFELVRVEFLFLKVALSDLPPLAYRLKAYRQFTVSLVSQDFIERALCSFDRSEFNVVSIQIMVSIRLTSFGAWVDLKV
jgi:hypothetical protein